MHAVCHTTECRHALALASGRNNDRLVLRIIFQPLNIDQCILRYADTVQVRSGLNNIHHASSLNHNLSAELVSSIDDLLHSIDIRSKRRDDDTCLFMFLKQGIKDRSKLFLRRCEARPFCVGAVAHQCQHTFFSKLGKTLQINRISIDRRIIYLEVACMNDDAGWRINCQRCCIHNTVICLDELNTETSEIDILSEFHDFSAHIVHEIVLCQLIFDNSHRKLSGINRHINLLEHIR